MVHSSRLYVIPSLAAAVLAVGVVLLPGAASAVPIPAPGPVLVATKLSLDFGVIDPAAGATPDQVVTLLNQGTAVVNFDPVVAPADYTISATTCAATLAPFGSCTYNLAFDPTTLGAKNRTILIGSDGGDVSIALSGYGSPPLAGAGLVMTPRSIDFGSLYVGDATSRTIDFSNQGTGSVVNLFFTAPSAPFSHTTTCPLSGQLDPGDSCIVTLTYTPTAVGSASSQLTTAVGWTVDMVGNGRPVLAAADASYSTAKNTALAISNPTLGVVGISDGWVVDFDSVTSQPASGTVAVASDGTWTYTPAAGFIGTVAFTYQLADYRGTFDQGVITIKVTGVLPATGFDALPAVAIGGSLLVVGALILVLRRRNSTR